jgi:outer membrane protein TolC
MNLPFDMSRKRSRAVDQRQAEWVAQKYQLEDLHNRVVTKVQQAITDYRRAGEQAQLFQQEIIPQAQQTVDAMLAGYQVGSVDFLNLVRSQTTLYNYETQYWKALSSANQASARLVAAVGEEKIYE